LPPAVDEKTQTAKITLPTPSKPVPQATVNLKAAPTAAAPAPAAGAAKPAASISVAGKPGASVVAKPGASVVAKPGASVAVKAAPAGEKGEGVASVSVAAAVPQSFGAQEAPPVFALAAAAAVVIALGVQIWTMLG